MPPPTAGLHPSKIIATGTIEVTDNQQNRILALKKDKQALKNVAEWFIISNFLGAVEFSTYKEIVTRYEGQNGCCYWCWGGWSYGGFGAVAIWFSCGYY
jgi:hypothetical protein